MRLFISVLLLSLVAVSPARASVMYTWVPLAGVGNAWDLLKMTDAAYASGLVNWEVYNHQPDPDQPDPTGPILGFEFEAYGVTLGSTTRFIGGFNFHRTRIGDGLAGHIDANNTGNEVHHASLQYDGTLWRMNGANTEFGGCSNDACTGDLGRWQRAGQAGVPDAVPEPLSAALLGIGLLGLAALRQRHA